MEAERKTHFFVEATANSLINAHMKKFLTHCLQTVLFEKARTRLVISTILIENSPDECKLYEINSHFVKIHFGLK